MFGPLTHVKVNHGLFSFLGPFDRKVNKFLAPSLSRSDTYYKNDSSDQVGRVTRGWYGCCGGDGDGIVVVVMVGMGVVTVMWL